MFLIITISCILERAVFIFIQFYSIIYSNDFRHNIFPIQNPVYSWSSHVLYLGSYYKNPSYYIALSVVSTAHWLHLVGNTLTPTDEFVAVLGVIGLLKCVALVDAAHSEGHERWISLGYNLIGFNKYINTFITSRFPTVWIPILYQIQLEFSEAGVDPSIITFSTVTLLKRACIQNHMNFQFWWYQLMRSGQ